MIDRARLLEFVRATEGRKFTTASHGNAFTCRVVDDAIWITRSTGTEKKVTRKRITLFCDRFNQTKSFVASDYHRDLTAAASQLLVLTRAMLNDVSVPTCQATSRQVTNIDSPSACLTPTADAGDRAEPSVTRLEHGGFVTAHAHSASGGHLRITKQGMDFQYDSSGVNESAPLLYLWTIHDTAGRIWYTYVGKAKGGLERPAKSYVSVVKRLQRGGPYRQEKPMYRVVHQRMAEAVERGFTIRLKLIRNVLPPEDIDTAEAQARAEYSKLYGIPCG